MSQEFTMLLIVLVGAVALVSLFLVIGVLFERTIKESQQIASRIPGRAFLLGLVNTLFLGVILVVFVALSEWMIAYPPIFYLPALVALALFAAGATLGLASIAPLIGARLFPERDGWQTTILGGLALTLASLVPFIGWFGLLPYVTLLGFGALLIALFQRFRPSRKDETTAE